ncbi:alpha-rhamnosidase [Colletotrichum truncatum]|uniref:Alpha-rhamnosidase n=1 Tax=Colletotrichum truncatum TaxID=5467 RepID=A0ACC3ZHP2_COLTU|nr:alpha-rhamnosidase [Colletotrichum truncatum]KAF6790534.1 alpha-rhamnosidase [Colletotrichum truncatum]
MSSLQITDLRFEHLPNGLGVPSSTPRMSWRISSTAIPNNWNQDSYDIEITRHGKEPKTFHVKGTSTALVAWPDTPLSSAEAATVRVKSNGTFDNGQQDTEWSQPATVEAALLSHDSWAAKPITAPPRSERHPDERGIRPVRFRKTFDIPELNGRRARLYITSLGIYEAYLNGKRIGDEWLAPGWTAYQHRIQYQVFDIGQLLKPGQTNVLSVEVSEGWYAGRVLWGDGLTCFYGDRIGVLAQLDVLDDASSAPGFRLTTDETWECHPSPIVGSEIYDGEAYDLNLEVPDWHHDKSKWTSVETLPFPKVSLVASSSPPVRITETVKPVKIFTDPSGKTLVDFGQNLVGKLVVHSLQKPDNHRLSIRHAEVLENGFLGIRPLRRAKQIDTIIFGNGYSLENWSPHFTYHGFRYVELDGWAADEVTLDSVSAVVMHTDMKRTGFFSCSNDDINALHRNVTWSMRGNFVSIPTDCPQRDERLGWTGDIQVFSPTASFLYDCAGMLSNWMRDVVLDQKDANGVVPLVVPNVMKDGPFPPLPQAIWDDVIILVPWTLYKWFGDVGVLQETYSGMIDYLKSIQRGEDGLWDPALWQLGDWLDPNAPPAEPGLARTDGTLVADAYLVHVTGVISQIAGILNNADDAERFASEHKRLKQLFQDKYIAKSGFIVADSQTALALALLFNLHDTAAQRKAAAERLSRLVKYSKFRVSTGFAGTPVILHALSEMGYIQHAYRMLLETGCPSWLYPVRMGATTVWERWDSMLEDGTINPGEMTSFNHYALGSVANWMHASIGGLSPLEPGWKKFSVKPRPGGDLKHAEVEFLSPSGQVRSRWEINSGGKLNLELTVPPNASAVVSLPDGSEDKTVGSGTYTFESDLDEEVKGEWPPQALLTQFGLP